MKNQKKTLEEKIKEADLKITVRKGQQDFIFLWQEQSEVIRKLELMLAEKFGVAGKPRAITLGCLFLLQEIEAEFGSQEKDGKE